MSVSDAKYYARQTLRGAFGKRFEHGNSFTDQCSRVSPTRFICSPTWSYGPNDYYGGVTVWYEIQRDAQLWTDHYGIRWVNDHCYFRSGHPHRCKVYSASGTY